MKDFFKKIHFVGIGGIGTSSLAQFFLKKGYVVSGSDIKKSETTEFLEKKGVKIFLGHKKENLPEEIRNNRVFKKKWSKSFLGT